MLLVGAGWLQWRPGRACPTDPLLARLCATAQKWNRRVLVFSIAMWGVGAFAAYLALPLRKAFGV